MEGDRVRVGDEDLVILGVHYNDFNCLNALGNLMPLYRVGPENGGWHTSVRTEDIELIERGPHYAFFIEGTTPDFGDDVEALANFYGNVHGQIEEVRNPYAQERIDAGEDEIANPPFGWTGPEAWQAVHDGHGDAMKMTRYLFGIPPKPYVVRYTNREVGERVRAYFMEHFATKPTS